jgi:hypothetical protein
MNRRITFFSVAAGLAAWCLTAVPGHADSKQLSPERLDMLDQMGYFTPGFKAATHDLVDGKHALEQVSAEQTKLTRDLPALEREAAESEAKAVALRRELAKYDHPEENDFVTLQNRMNDTGAKPEEQIVLAQAYVWTYPASPHQSEAQQYLQRTQKKLADQRQAEKDAEVSRAAARAELVQRAQAKDLNLAEWRDFLRDMSQDDLVRLLGRPTSQRGDYWIYSGAWITDPATHQRVGMEINFNAGRVISVGEEPHSP